MKKTEDIELWDDQLPSAQPDEYVPVGLTGVLDATRKVLAMNRGLTGPDNRDGIQFIHGAHAGLSCLLF